MGQGSHSRGLESCSAILLAPFSQSYRKGAGEREGTAANAFGEFTNSDARRGQANKERGALTRTETAEWGGPWGAGEGTPIHSYTNSNISIPSSQQRKTQRGPDSVEEPPEIMVLERILVTVISLPFCCTLESAMDICLCKVRLKILQLVNPTVLRGHPGFPVRSVLNSCPLSPGSSFPYIQWGSPTHR